MSSGVVIVAGGTGRRFGKRTPKQFLRLGGRPLYLAAALPFLRVRAVKEIVFVVPRDRVAAVQRQVRAARLKVAHSVVAGGAFRGESVRNGVLALTARHETILIHDAARPLVDAATVTRVERAARRGPVVAAWPLADTLKRADHRGRVRQTVCRDGLWVAQTPQGFPRRVALACLLKPHPAATDDVALAEPLGYRVRVVEGSRLNFKITFPSDLKWAEAIMGKVK